LCRGDVLQIHSTSRMDVGGWRSTRTCRKVTISPSYSSSTIRSPMKPPAQRRLYFLLTLTSCVFYLFDLFALMVFTNSHSFELFVDFSFWRKQTIYHGPRRMGGSPH
uniref:MAC/Perforin domain-containing protein n=1 Tax=Toxocara canis TaxID=6265 RepID=A0A183U548_TOXCA